MPPPTTTPALELPSPGRLPGSASMLAAAARVGQLLLFGAVPLVVTAALFASLASAGVLYFDFEGTVWEPTRAILSGSSPFPAPAESAVDVGNPAVYPPSVVFVGLPFAALPLPVAGAIFAGLLLVAVAGGLLVLGVRDWRCHALALSSLPVLLAATFGNVTPLLVAGVAVAWKFRDRDLVAGAAVGAAVALKLFLWPLAVWLIATRRYRAAAVSIVGAVVSVLLPWTWIGFAGLRDYPSLLQVEHHVFSSHTSSVYAAALGLGLPELGARAAAVAIGTALLATCLFVARRRRNDVAAISAALAAALVFTPLVWPHYLALLLVPVALLRPRLHVLWAVVPASTIVFFALPLPRGDSVGRPADVPAVIWEPLHAASPPTAHALAFTVLLAVTLFATLRLRLERA